MHAGPQSAENAEDVFGALYGEDDWRVSRTVAEANREAGLIGPKTRDNMIAWAFRSAMDEIELPGYHRLSRRLAGRRLIEYLLGIFVLIIVLVMPANLVMKNYGEDSKESGIIVMVLTVGLVLSIAAWTAYYGAGARRDWVISRAQKHVLKRFRNRVATSLGPIEPTGSELQQYLMYARREGLYAGEFNAEMVLQDIHEMPRQS